MSRRAHSSGTSDSYSMHSRSQHDARSSSVASSYTSGGHRRNQHGGESGSAPSRIRQTLPLDAFGVPSPSAPPLFVPYGLRPFISYYLQGLQSSPPAWMAGDLLETQRLLYEWRDPDRGEPSNTPHSEVVNNASQLRTALEKYNPHHSTNTVIGHMIGWCAWTGGLGLLQADIQGSLGKLPTLRSLHRLISEGQDPFAIFSQEAIVQEQVLVELCDRINHHALALTKHLQKLPQDLSEAGQLARMFAWTRKRVKMTESFLVLSGAVVATLPQLGASDPVNTYAGAGMTLLGGLKVVWQHFADDPNGSAAAYESGQSATNALRHDGTKLLIAWLELFGVVQLLLERAKSETPLTDAEKEQIRDFFVSFHKHFQPSKDDISKVYTKSEQSFAKKYPNLKEQYDDRYAVPSAKRFPYPHRLQPTAEESTSSPAASSSRRDQRRPDRGPSCLIDS